MADQPYEDSEGDFSGELSDAESLLDFFSGEPSIKAQKSDPNETIASNNIYGPLEDGEIRIIILHRVTSDSDTIRCSFKKTSIRWPAPYTALSYAWGEVYEDDSHLTHTVFCDGVPLKITNTLHQALNRIRQDRSEIVPCFWIDAICINQKDHTERSAQVMIMDKVYSNATHLLIWLGEEDGFPRVLDNLDEEGEDRTSISALTPARTTRQNFPSAPWFSRRWVIQEATSCKSGHSILVGSRRFSVTNVVDVLSDPLTRPLSSSATDPPRSTSSRQRTLFANLIRHRRALCSDDRDRIYALRNISSDGDYLPIDYSKTTGELYTSLALLWIMAGYTSKVLSSAAHSEQVRQELQVDSALPSWVPDWRLMLRETWHSNVTNGPSLGIPGPARLDAEYITISSGPCLRLRGWVIRQCQHHNRDMANVSPTPPGSDCCRILKNLNFHHNLEVVEDGVRKLDDLDAVLLIENDCAFRLKLARRSQGGNVEQCWALFGSQHSVPLFQRDGNWYLHSQYEVPLPEDDDDEDVPLPVYQGLEAIRLPEIEYVYLV